MKTHLWLRTISFFPGWFLMARKFPEKYLFWNCTALGYILNKRSCLSFFSNFCTLLQGWWIAISKLNLCLIPCILTHVSRKWTQNFWGIWSWVTSPQLIGSWLLACMKSWRWYRSATERFFLIQSMLPSLHVGRILVDHLFYLDWWAKFQLFLSLQLHRKHRHCFGGNILERLW